MCGAFRTVVLRGWIAGGLVAGLLMLLASAVRAEDKPVWHAPFGGVFNANFTFTTDYSYAGVSAAGRKPAFQPGLDYRTPTLLEDPQLWLYLGLWGSNIVEPAGSGVEADISGGVKFKPTDRLRLDFGYVYVTYPGFAPSLSYNYGDFSINADYDFGPAQLNARLRFSPDSFGGSGWEFNKRGFLTVPLDDYLKLGDKVSVKTYGSLGNFSVQRYVQYGLGVPEYWYWQFGFLVSAFGLDMNFAYTDANIGWAGCGGNANCDARVFFAVSKIF